MVITISTLLLALLLLPLHSA